MMLKQIRQAIADINRDSVLGDLELEQTQEPQNSLPVPVERQTGLQQPIKAGAIANLYDENPFTQFFDYVEYEEGYFKEYETLADPQVQKKPIREMKAVAAKSNPHFKAAMTDFQDYVVGGWGFKPDKTIVIDNFLDVMENEFDGFDSYLSDMTDSMFLNSAWFHESVYDERLFLGRFVCLDHNTAKFKQGKKGVYGQDYLLYQEIQGSFGSEPDKYLEDDPTTFYAKLYSKANYPFGVPFVDASIFHMVMMVEFFKSYKSLLDSFVLPNLFFRVDREIVEKVVTDPTERPGFVANAFRQLLSQVRKLRPGRIITMGSEVMEPEILSGMNEKTMGASESLINALDNQLELALKTHGLTTLRNDSALNDTKAKYRMANYSRIIKRAQRVGTNRLNGQFNQAHTVARSRDRSELYLERNIYEDEQILAEISTVVREAVKAGAEAMTALIEALDRAVEKGYLTQAQANQKFIDEVDRIENQVKFSDNLLE